MITPFLQSRIDDKCGGIACPPNRPCSCRVWAAEREDDILPQFIEDLSMIHVDLGAWAAARAREGWSVETMRTHIANLMGETGRN